MENSTILVDLVKVDPVSKTVNSENLTNYQLNFIQGENSTDANLSTALAAFLASLLSFYFMLHQNQNYKYFNEVLYRQIHHKHRKPYTITKQQHAESVRLKKLQEDEARKTLKLEKSLRKSGRRKKELPGSKKVQFEAKPPVKKFYRKFPKCTANKKYLSLFLFTYFMMTSLGNFSLGLSHLLMYDEKMSNFLYLLANFCNYFSLIFLILGIGFLV